MLVLDAAIARERKINMRISEISVVGDRKFKIERAKWVRSDRAFRNLIVPRILHRPCICQSLAAEALNIAELAAADVANVALYGDFLFGLVHLAVVKYEPSQRVRLIFFIPTSIILPVIFGIFR